jgi:hypothetical protein
MPANDRLSEPISSFWASSPGVDARGQVALRDAGRGLLELADGPRNGACHGQPDAGAEQETGHHHRHQRRAGRSHGAVGVPAHLGDLSAHHGDRLFQLCQLATEQGVELLVDLLDLAIADGAAGQLQAHHALHLDEARVHLVLIDVVHRPDQFPRILGRAGILEE